MDTINQIRTKLEELLIEMIMNMRPGTSQISSERILSITCNILRQVGIFGSILLAGSRKWPAYWIIVPVFLILTQERQRKIKESTSNHLDVVKKNFLKGREYNLPIWGVLRVHFVEAKDLITNNDNFILQKKFNRYTIIYLGDDKFETPKVSNTEVIQKWNYYCEFKVFFEMVHDLLFEVWEKNLSNSDELLGRTSIDLHALAKRGSIDGWFDLDDVDHGSLHLDLQWYELTNDPNELDAALQDVQNLQVPTLSSAVLSVYIESAKNLKHPNTDPTPDPYVICTINDQREKSNIIMRTNSPVWEQGISLFVQDPNFDVLKVEIFDNKTDTTIGGYDIDICDLLEAKNLEMGLQCYFLDNASSESEIKMALSLAILKKKDVTKIEEELPDGEDFDNEKQLEKYEEFKRRQLPIWLNESSLQHNVVVKKTNQNLTFVHPMVTSTLFNRKNKTFVTNELATAIKTLFSQLKYAPTCITTFVAKTTNYGKIPASDDFCNKFSVIMKFPYSNKLLSTDETPKIVQCLDEEHSTAMELSLEC